MRVAVLSRAVFPLHGHGGLERHTGDLVRHLAARGVAVTLLTREPVRGAPSFDVAGVTLLTIPYRSFPLAGRRGTTVLDRSTAYLWFGRRLGRLAADLARQDRIDIVYGLGAAALGYATALLKGEGAERGVGAPRATELGGVGSPPFKLVPLVFNPQGLEEFGGADLRFGGSPLKRIGYLPLRHAVRACARAADCVIATDRSLEAVVERHLGVPSSRTRTIPNAIDVAACDRRAGARDAAGLKRDLGTRTGERVLLSVGRLERNKGLHVLIDALKAARDLGWRWVVVGDGPHGPRLRAVTRAAGLGDRITFVGRVDDERLHEWYEAADLFVHPTLYEGSSLVTLEAMAHRLPVIASDAGGLPDKVRPGVNGWLVPPGDPAPLADAIRHALSPQQDLASMGRAGRAIVEREFTWDVVIPRMMGVFSALRHKRC
ncbi:MAG: glycosyltransferase family 4 protein [Acidobacteria bacterium]|nr:glycosyltransferase family 4 protein [Acidobacteriota bacterium]